MTASQDGSLAGQVALVTGGGAGIGQGVAVALARHGADVVIADIDPDRAKVTAGLIDGLGRHGVTAVADVMQPEQIRSAADAATDRFGQLDILVNNAGGVRGQPFMAQSERSWRRHIDLNLVSVLAGTASAVPHMIAGGRGGSILNITSIESTRAAPMYAVYAACKAAVNSFTRTMAVELAEHQITVNALLPDWIATPGNHGIVSGPVPEPLPDRPAQLIAGLARYIPLGREGTVEDIAEAAAFLVSPAGRYITGVALPVDGGTWASSGWTRTQTGGWGLFHPWVTDVND